MGQVQGVVAAEVWPAGRNQIHPTQKGLVVMAIRIQIEDLGDGAMTISLSAPGGYNPDVLDDLTSKALCVYKEVICVVEARPAVELTEGVCSDDVE